MPNNRDRLSIWRRSNLVCTLCLALSLTCLQGCSGDPKPGQKLANEGDLTEAERGEVLARVGDWTLTLDAFEQSLDAQSPFVRASYRTLERKREYLDAMVRFELLTEEAKDHGFDRLPDVVLARKQAMVRLLTAEILRETPVDDSSDQLEPALRNQKMRQQKLDLMDRHVGQLRKQANVQIDEQFLEKAPRVNPEKAPDKPQLEPGKPEDPIP